MDQLQNKINLNSNKKEFKIKKNDKLNKKELVEIIDPAYFKPEVENGNIEYKLKLNPSKERFEHLLTQMNWRIREGKGEAIYRLGVADNGLCVGLIKKEADLTLKTIERMAKKLNYTSNIVSELTVKVKDKTNTIRTRKVYELLIKEVNRKDILPDLRIALVGNTNSGKSSLISVLTQGILDDGEGKARSTLGFRHRHELESGHTTSISREIYGYDKDNNILNYNGRFSLDNFYQLDCLLDNDLLNNSKYLVSLLDLAGNRKYLSTTLYGLIGNSVNFSFLVLNSTTDLIDNSKEYLNILLTLNLPFLILINKIDLGSETECSNLIKNLSNYLNNRKLNMIENENDIDNYFNQSQQTNIPLIKCSCLTGQSIHLIYRFVHQLITRTQNVFDTSDLIKISPLEFLIQDVFYQNEETCVLGGLVINGQINKNDLILIGPTEHGKFIQCKVLSIERYKSSVNFLKNYESGSLELEFNKENLNQLKVSENIERINFDKEKNRMKIRKGMAIVSINCNLSTIKISKLFKVNFKLTNLTSTIRKGFQAKIYIDNIKQTVSFEEIENLDEITKTGDYIVTLRFIKHPEIIRIGSKFFLHDNKMTYGCGLIINYS